MTKCDNGWRPTKFRFFFIVDRVVFVYVRCFINGKWWNKTKLQFSCRNVQTLEFYLNEARVELLLIMSVNSSQCGVWQPKWQFSTIFLISWTYLRSFLNVKSLCEAKSMWINNKFRFLKNFSRHVYTQYISTKSIKNSVRGLRFIEWKTQNSTNIFN